MKHQWSKYVENTPMIFHHMNEAGIPQHIFHFWKYFYDCICLLFMCFPVSLGLCGLSCQKGQWDSLSRSLISILLSSLLVCVTNTARNVLETSLNTNGSRVYLGCTSFAACPKSLEYFWRLPHVQRPERVKKAQSTSRMSSFVSLVNCVRQQSVDKVQVWAKRTYVEFSLLKI